MKKTRINWKVAAVSGTLVGVGLGGFANADDPFILPDDVVLEQPATTPDVAVASVPASVNAPTQMPDRSPADSMLSSPTPPAAPTAVADVASPASPVSVASVAPPAPVAPPPVVAADSPSSPVSSASPASAASPASIASS